MKNMRNLVMAMAMMVVLGVNTSFAGILMSDFNGNETPAPCTQQTDKADWGVIIGGFGVIIGGFGVIIGGLTDSDAKGETVNCGVIFNSGK
jgi:hypothetical protein